MAKILVIEDDSLMSQMYEKIFTFGGYRVEMAKDGKEGLEKARSRKPDLIFLDIMMPEMDGMQVLDKLKADSEAKDIPVVMLTNLAGQQEAEEAFAKGALRYIVKSEYEPKQIIGIVEEILKHTEGKKE